MGPISCTETSVTTSQRCVTSQKSEDLRNKRCCNFGYFTQENIQYESIKLIAAKQKLIEDSFCADCTVYCVCLSDVCLSVCLSVCLFACLSVCLSLKHNINVQSDVWYLTRVNFALSLVRLG